MSPPLSGFRADGVPPGRPAVKDFAARGPVLGWGGNHRDRTRRMSRNPLGRTLIIFVVLTASLAAGAYFLFRPVCVPIDEATLAIFSPPIEQRRETTFYGSPLYQRRGAQWYQCKTWLSRQFFF